MAKQLDILALEPFYGGGRRHMLETLIHYSRHRWTLLKLPPRRIERRLTAAAHWFAEQLTRHWVGRVDLLFTSEALNLADLYRLMPTLLKKPSVVYFHDNQLPHPSSTSNNPLEMANLNTATFDKRGILWFTGQSGIYGRLNPKTGAMRVFRAPLGPGPYGITTTPTGQVFYASLAGSHIAQIDVRTGKATVIRPPTAGQGARRVWSNSKGMIWVSEWNAGKVARYDPATRKWREWDVPGPAKVYAVYVDEKDVVWLTDFGRSGLWRFVPATGQFTRIPLRAGADVRQLLGRPGEVWGAESGADRLVVVRG